MPTNPEVFYLSAEDYQGQSTVPNLVQKMSGEEVEALLLETMALIDAYIGDGWTPFDDDQEFTFPRDIDEDANGNIAIPRPVSLATRLIADAILEERQKGVLPHQVASEGNEGHSYSKYAKSLETEQGFDVFPPSAIALLQKYRRAGGVWVVE